MRQYHLGRGLVAEQCLAQPPWGRGDDMSKFLVLREGTNQVQY